MKIKNCFVSNSSTSSFVCIGVDVTDDIKLKEKYISDGDWGLSLSLEGKKNLPENTECICHEGYGEILGWEFASGSSDDCSFDCADISIEELSKYSTELEKVTGVKPKLIGGAYCS